MDRRPYDHDADLLAQSSAVLRPSHWRTWLLDGTSHNTKERRLVLAVNSNGPVRAQSVLEDDKADPNVERDWQGRPPLHLAVRLAHVEIMKMIVEHGADPHDTGDEFLPYFS